VGFDIEGLENLGLCCPEISGGLYPQLACSLIYEPKILHFYQFLSGQFAR